MHAHYWKVTQVLPDICLKVCQCSKKIYCASIDCTDEAKTLVDRLNNGEDCFRQLIAQLLVDRLNKEIEARTPKSPHLVKSYYEQHKTEILCDYHTIGKKETILKWHISRTQMRNLQIRWGLKRRTYIKRWDNDQT